MLRLLEPQLEAPAKRRLGEDPGVGHALGLAPSVEGGIQLGRRGGVHRTDLATLSDELGDYVGLGAILLDRGSHAARDA
jgi:hypothetical protein